MFADDGEHCMHAQPLCVTTGEPLSVASSPSSVHLFKQETWVSVGLQHIECYLQDLQLVRDVEERRPSKLP